MSQPLHNNDLSSPAFWSETFRLRSYDVDFRKRATLEGICRYYLDAAWNHAEALGVGYTQLAEDGRFWVLSRLLLNVKRLPFWGETVTLRTWPRAVKGVFAMRDFELLDSHGDRLVGGASAWLVLDGSSRRPQRLEKLRWTLSEFPERRATDQEPGKLAECLEAAECFATTVRHGDLDVNDHLTSCTYLRWLLDCYSQEFHCRHTVQCVEINFVGETRSNDCVSLRLKKAGPATYCHTMLKSTNEEVCRARLLWCLDSA